MNNKKGPGDDIITVLGQIVHVQCRKDYTKDRRIAAYKRKREAQTRSEQCKENQHLITRETVYSVVSKSKKTMFRLTSV